MTGFETKFFVILILLISVLILFAGEKLTVCVSFWQSIDQSTKTTDEIKGSIIAPSLVTAVAYVL
jgi:hypothetical protein